MENSHDSPRTSVIARYASLQSVAEIAIGSIVHSVQLPFGGHALSLNQGLLLTFSLKTCANRREAVSTVSSIAHAAAILKALSPAGKRLTPMLAISAQGLLYCVGVAAFGPTCAGAALGISLLSLWGFAQPLLVAYLLFGGTFFEGLLRVWSEIARAFSLSESVLWPVLGAVVLLKISAAVAIAALAWRSGPALESAYLAELERVSSLAAHGGASRAGGTRSVSPLRSALGDLLNPWFLAGSAMSVFFFAYSGSAGAPEIVLYGLRILGAALLLFWAIRAVPRAWISRALSRFPQVQAAADQAFERLSRR